MSKSKKQELDLAMANELDLELSPFVLVLKHVLQLTTPVGGFAFAHRTEGVIGYDTVDLWRNSLGMRIKPERFLMPSIVRLHLLSKAYQRWYYFDYRYLYPVQPVKASEFLESFWFVEDSDPHYRSSVVCNPEEPFNLRKKPLVACRQKLIDWPDVCPHLPNPILKATVSYKKPLTPIVAA